MDEGVKHEIERGFAIIAKRFDDRGAQIHTLSNELTRISVHLENLSKTVGKLEDANLSGLRVEVATCQTQVEEIKRRESRNGWFLVTSMLFAITALLGVVGSMVWDKLNK